MKPAPFDYIAPDSVENTLAILEEHGYSAKLLAGGQSLIPAMNFRLAQPGLLIDLNNIQELSTLNPDGSHGMRIGAMVRHATVEHSPIIREMAPLMHEVMPHIAHPQIRNRGTIGGSLAHADPASELPVVMVALQAELTLNRAGSERKVMAQDFFEGLFTTVLEAEELLTEIYVPAKSPDTGFAFSELARRHGDYASAGLAAIITLDNDGICRQARLVYLSAGDIPMVAGKAGAMMIGEEPVTQLIEEAAHFASRHEIDPTADIHATAEYKRHLAYILGKRTIQQAISNARAKLQS